MSNANEPSDADVLQAKITLETAQIPWRELQRFFASGKAVAVDPALDLTQVATAFARDDKARFEAWLQQKRVAPVSDEQAEHWYQADALLWAVVVAPWVLVQPVQTAVE
jgi:hypothetical protein